MQQTLGSALSRHRGIGPGFDLLRIGLAMLIFIGHCKWISGGAPMLPHIGGDAAGAGAQAAAVVTHDPRHWTGIGRLKLSWVPSFFALSGFLVAGSALRTMSTPTFLAHRSLRIFPALMVETLLSAFILGPLLTTLPLSSYFSAPMLWRYLGNMIGWITYLLPGVFETNPVPGTLNANLWTLPAEMYCYLIMAALMLTRLAYKRTFFTVAVIAATIGLATWHALTGASNPQGPYPLHVVTYYFFVGVAFFHWRDRIPAQPWMCFAAAAVAALTLFDDRLTYVTPIFLVYATVTFGILPVPKIPLLSTGDYSYGVYLYGFPISQAIIYLVPSLRGHTILFAAISTIATLLFAAGSWHLIEKHVLAGRKFLPERWFPTTPRQRAQVAEAG